MTEDERAELQLAEEICRRFLGCDLLAAQESAAGAKRLLAQILGREEMADDVDTDMS